MTLRGVTHTALDTNKHHHQQQVAYALTYNSVGTITAATADLVVANITCCGSASCSLAVAQTFSASWTDADATATAGVVARWGLSTYMRVCARVEPQLPCIDHPRVVLGNRPTSGNPGYINGAPVLAGYIVRDGSGEDEKTAIAQLTVRAVCAGSCSKRRLWQPQRHLTILHHTPERPHAARAISYWCMLCIRQRYVAWVVHTRRAHVRPNMCVEPHPPCTAVTVGFGRDAVFGCTVSLTRAQLQALCTDQTVSITSGSLVSPLSLTHTALCFPPLATCSTPTMLA